MRLVTQMRCEAFDFAGEGVKLFAPSTAFAAPPSPLSHFAIAHLVAALHKPGATHRTERLNLCCF